MNTFAQYKELNEAQSAELLRLGFIAGHYSVADVVQWADSRVEADSNTAALDLALAGQRPVADVTVMLKEVAVDADRAARTQDVAALIGHALDSGRIQAREAHHMIARLALATADERLNCLVNTWQDKPYTRGSGGEPGAPVSAREILADLKAYESSPGAWKDEV